jgi:hypothetical protein
LVRFQKSLAPKSGIVRLDHVGQLFTDGLPVVIVGRLHDRRDGFVMLPGEVFQLWHWPWPFSFAIAISMSLVAADSVFGLVPRARLATVNSSSRISGLTPKVW